MKSFATLLLAALLPAGTLKAPAQQTREVGADVILDAPPAGPASLPKPRRVPVTVQRRVGADVRALSFVNRAPASARPVVVHSGDAKIREQLQEDLAVMGRILEKCAAAYREEHEEAAGIPIMALMPGRGSSALYLEDYGAVFTLNVSILLKPELKPEEADDPPSGAANEEWNEARIELFGDRAALRARRTARREFDPRDLAELRESLIESLRHSSNIRHLRDDDWIAVILRGRGSEPEPDGIVDILIPGGPRATAALSEDRARDSAMILRVKKRDVDEFSRKRSSLESFKKSVSVLAY